MAEGQHNGPQFRAGQSLNLREGRAGAEWMRKQRHARRRGQGGAGYKWQSLQGCERAERGAVARDECRAAESEAIAKPAGRARVGACRVQHQVDERPIADIRRDGQAHVLEPNLEGEAFADEDIRRHILQRYDGLRRRQQGSRQQQADEPQQAGGPAQRAADERQKQVVECFHKQRTERGFGMVKRYHTVYLGEPGRR